MSTPQNVAIPPTELVTGVAATWQGIAVARVQLSPSTIPRRLHRIVLATTLTAGDVSATYWDGYSKCAPFYLFYGGLGLSNLLDLTPIGNLNIAEYLAPPAIAPGTDVIGLWLGVLAASAAKAQAVFYCEDR